MNHRLFSTLTAAIVVAAGLSCNSAQAESNSSAKAANAPQQWPMVTEADVQPLLVQVQRLVETLDYVGNPLSAEQKAVLHALQQEQDDAKLIRDVQAVLDPLCLAAVEISSEKFSSVVSPGKHGLVEQGWRSYLIKVCNPAGVDSRLTVESPNARPLPHAKAEDVPSRWMTISMYDRRPMQPDLSSLPLEYRIVQIYSNDSGVKEATLDFSVDLKSKTPGRHIRRWRFDQDADGWQNLNQTEIEVRDNAMYVTGTGDDPFIGAEVGNATGELLLRFQAETEDNGMAMVFWWTEERPEPDAVRVAMFPLIPQGTHEYEVVLPVNGVLAGIRIDPNVKPSKTRFDWIDLLYAKREGENWNRTSVTFDVAESIPLKFAVSDESGVPAVAAFEIRDQLGRLYPEQTKRLAPDLFFHPQIYRRDGEELRLPPGTYTVKCWRGPHSIPETKTVTVAGDSTTLEYNVKRWFDPTTHGWWSGDHHIHAAGCLHYVNPTEGVTPGDMLRQTMGEDLNIGCCLNWGPSFDFQKQFFTGQVDRVSEYPYLLRYDVEVSGFGSHASGHLNLLRLQQQIYPGGESKFHWPTLGLNTLRWAKSQGAICGPAHSGNGLTNYIGRMDGYEDGPHGLPHYNIPRFDGIGACEYIVDVTHELPGPDGEMLPAIDFISTMDTPRKDEWNMWYHSLNCGFRVKASGETDFPCMSGERVGIGRVYVNCGERLDFVDWIQGIKDGRSYVSDGKVHLLDFEARRAGQEEFLPIGEAGSELTSKTPARFEFRAQCAALLDTNQLASGQFSEINVELIVNGLPRDSQTIKANGELQTLSFTAEIDKSAWVALRVFPHAHTNPFFVVVDDKPIRASKASAEWCLKCVEQCWQEKRSTYAEAEQQDAVDAYNHARRIYKQIREECAE